jgi:hypothetical protein
MAERIVERLELSIAVDETGLLHPPVPSRLQGTPVLEPVSGSDIATLTRARVRTMRGPAFRIASCLGNYGATGAESSSGQRRRHRPNRKNQRRGKARAPVGDDAAQWIRDGRELADFSPGHLIERAARNGSGFEQPAIRSTRNAHHLDRVSRHNSYDHFGIENPFQLIGQPERDAAE